VPAVWHVCAHGRTPSGGRWLQPTRERGHIDDLKNPEYRKGRWRRPREGKPEPVRRPGLTEAKHRAQFADQAARAAFGRFYWNDELGRRMELELEKSRRFKREAEERARRRRRNGARD